MKIKDLPQEIKELALLRQKQFEGETNENVDLDDAFIWMDTKEGLDFWGEIDEGNFKPFYDQQKSIVKEIIFNEMIKMLEQLSNKINIEYPVGNSQLLVDLDKLLVKAKTLI